MHMHKHIDIDIDIELQHLLAGRAAPRRAERLVP